MLARSWAWTNGTGEEVFFRRRCGGPRSQRSWQGSRKCCERPWCCGGCRGRDATTSASTGGACRRALACRRAASGRHPVSASTAGSVGFRCPSIMGVRCSSIMSCGPQAAASTRKTGASSSVQSCPHHVLKPLGMCCHRVSGSRKRAQSTTPMQHMARMPFGTHLRS